jgi:hypothetical protein
MERIDRSSLIGLLVVALAGCGNASMDTSTCVGTKGEMGKAQLSYVGCRGVDTNFLAAGGAKSSVDVTGVTFASVKVADPNIATFNYKGTGGSVDVVAGTPGTTELSLLDGNGAVIDRVAIIVKPTTSLDYDRGWGQSTGPTIVAGTRNELHVTTKNGTDVLVGTGAVMFTTKGSIKLDTLYANGDSAAFFADAGTSTLVADAMGGGHLEITVIAIDPATVTAVEMVPKTQDVDSGKEGLAVITFNAGDLPVYGGECQWAFTGPTVHATLYGGSSLSHLPWTIYTLKADSAGAATATCTLFGGKTLTVQLNFK